MRHRRAGFSFAPSYPARQRWEIDLARNFAHPDTGALRAFYRDGDFLDGQSVPLSHPAPHAAERTIATFCNMPGGAGALRA